MVVGVYTGRFRRMPQGWRFVSWVADLAHGSALSTDEAAS